MSLPEGTPGSRTHYTIEITAREKEACERFIEGSSSFIGSAPMVVGDVSLIKDLLRKIASLPKKDLDKDTG